MEPALGDSLDIGIVFASDEVSALGKVMATITALADIRTWRGKMSEIV